MTDFEPLGLVVETSSLAGKATLAFTPNLFNAFATGEVILLQYTMI